MGPQTTEVALESSPAFPGLFELPSALIGTVQSLEILWKLPPSLSILLRDNLHDIYHASE